MKEAAAGIEEEAITSAKEAASSKSEAVAGGGSCRTGEGEDGRPGRHGVHQAWQSEEGGWLRAEERYWAQWWRQPDFVCVGPCPVPGLGAFFGFADSQLWPGELHVGPMLGRSLSVLFGVPHMPAFELMT